MFLLPLLYTLSKGVQRSDVTHQLAEYCGPVMCCVCFCFGLFVFFLVFVFVVVVVFLLVRPQWLINDTK